MAERYCVPESGPWRFNCVGSCTTEKKICRILPSLIFLGSYLISTDYACPVVPLETML
jgi:hypothetical protein